MQRLLVAVLILELEIGNPLADTGASWHRCQQQTGQKDAACEYPLFSCAEHEPIYQTLSITTPCDGTSTEKLPVAGIS